MRCEDMFRSLYWLKMVTNFICEFTSSALELSRYSLSIKQLEGNPALIAATTTVKVYVYDGILMLIAAHRFDMSDLDDVYAHLTNTGTLPPLTSPLPMLIVSTYTYRLSGRVNLRATIAARSVEDVSFDEAKFVQLLDDLPTHLLKYVLVVAADALRSNPSLPLVA